MAHRNTLFHSMLNFIPRHQFSALENQHSTGRKSRKFSRWNQFVHLMFMQLTGRKSLRDGIQSMNSRLKNLYHIGAQPVSRSTFADANNSGRHHFTRHFLKEYTSVAASYPPNISSNSKTNCTAWMRQSSTFPLVLFPGHHFAEPNQR